MIEFNKFIEINTNKRFGKPIIKGTRISVYDVFPSGAAPVFGEFRHFCADFEAPKKTKTAM